MKNYYPRGKFNDCDEGATCIQVSVQDKTLIIDFGRDLKWIGMDKFTAINMANIILEYAKSINTEQ